MNRIEHEAFIDGYLRYDHLIGIPFEHGENDCYKIPQRLLKDNLGIILRDFARPDDWWINGLDLYMDNFRSEGFELVNSNNVKDLQPLDIFLIAIPDERNPSYTVANHCAVYVGDGNILHHRLGKLSQCVPYRYSMKDWTTAIIRHKDVPDLREENKVLKVDLLDTLLPHQREKMMSLLNENTAPE